jgi:terminase small subunit / prophage DNA-packing protein
MKLDDDTVVTAAQFSWLTGLSDRALRGYANRGIVVRAGRGKYRLGESVRRLYHHASEAAAGRSGTNLSDARTKLADAQREQIELKMAIQRRELLRRDDVMNLWGPLTIGYRARALAWPGKALHVCPVLTLTDKAALTVMTEDDLTDCSLGRGFDFNTKAPEGEVEGKNDETKD